jgi:gluconolactonase
VGITLQAKYRTDEVRIFFNGVFSEPRLNHAEGIALDREGNIWCGGEEGEIYRISSKNQDRLEMVAKTGGFALGVATDSKGYVYVCDMKFGCVFRLQPDSGELIRFADGEGDHKMSCPNFALIDEANRWLYVSDSQENGPGIWRFNLDSGQGKLWFSGDCRFANGLAMDPQEEALYVAESFSSQISRIAIQADGSAGAKEPILTLTDTVPDGLVFDTKGRLYISCYEPSSIYRYTSDGTIELLVHDKQAQTLDHPTNMALSAEGELYITNLGAWHISVLSLGD